MVISLSSKATCQLIDIYTRSSTSRWIIHTILIKVDWIRFAEDYNSLRGVQKTAWLVSGFQRANPQIFANLDDQDTRKKLKEHAEELSAWKRKVGKDTTCRNRLYELFIEVSVKRSMISRVDVC